MCKVFVAPPMGFTVLLCFFVSALTPVCSSHAPREVRYECGPHGKFEYCIDEVPGCVVGCHCHPGYYFDTDSKICEPNVKLTHQFRQHNFAEPTPTSTAYPTLTTIAYNDDKVHKISKDTDELSDWLYNQFFKTIESQVINNSNNTKSSNEKPPTRRSGGGRVIKKSKRKLRKSVRGRKKRKYMKEHGLRKKLLRITEDDSLFDSDSYSDSDYSDSSSIESDSSDEDSADIDSGSDAKKTTDTDRSDDKDHGHKKVIIFNRRPKPPLPSFIFLPNMDTPYYPPIGLPPPPLVPMYPMVPVPPMAPPMFPPFPGPPNCGDESSKITTKYELPTTTTTVGPTTTTTTTTTTESTSETTFESTTETTTQTLKDSETTTDGTNRRNRPGKHRKRPNLEKDIASKPGKQKKFKHGPQSMLMQKLRDKLKGKRRNSYLSTHAKSLEELQDIDLQNSDDGPNISEDSTPHKRLHHEDQEENTIPKLNDVDFKYLSELIHRVNQSKSRRRPPLPFDLNEDFKELQKLQLPQQTRRNEGSYNPIPQVHRQGTDEIYYSNLGRQIASMIRNSDSKVDQQFIKDSEHANRQVPFHSVLNENIYAPRSFWERSVRSPILQKGPFSEYLDESRTLKHSNEKSLINLENEVEIFASTSPPLSLQDLENILNTMQKAHAEIKFRQPMTRTQQSNVSLNVNLLPKHIRPVSTYRRIFDVPEKVEYITQHYQTPLPPRMYIEMHPAVVGNASVFHEPERKYNVPYSDYWIYNPEPIQPKTSPRPVIAQTSKPVMRDNQVYKTNPMRQPFVGAVLPKQTETKKSRVGYLQFLNNRPQSKQTTSKTREPKIVKYKSLNYFSGNKHNMFEAASYPLLAPFQTQMSKRDRNEPSYFHQQSHNFEYFK